MCSREYAQWVCSWVHLEHTLLCWEYAHLSVLNMYALKYIGSILRMCSLKYTGWAYSWAYFEHIFIAYHFWSIRAQLSMLIMYIFEYIQSTLTRVYLMSILLSILWAHLYELSLLTETCSAKYAHYIHSWVHTEYAHWSLLNEHTLEHTLSTSSWLIIFDWKVIS